MNVRSTQSATFQRFVKIRRYFYSSALNKCRRSEKNCISRLVKDLTDIPLNRYVLSPHNRYVHLSYTTSRVHVLGASTCARRSIILYSSFSTFQLSGFSPLINGYYSNTLDRIIYSFYNLQAKAQNTRLSPKNIERSSINNRVKLFSVCKLRGARHDI